MSPVLKTATSIAETLSVPKPGPRGAAAAGGVQLTIRRTNQVDGYEKAISHEAARAAPAAMAVQGDNFAGTARKVAKLSKATGHLEHLADVKALIASLASDDDMKNHDPEILPDATFNRVQEEERNVQLKAWIYAASREADNDFHLIVGRDPGASEPMYMTMEVSGLPAHNAATFAAIKAARDTFTGAVQKTPGAGYDFYDPPIAVEIGGSLFFDITHATGGRPGPKDLRGDMPVIWEVHPVLHLVIVE